MRRAILFIAACLSWTAVRADAPRVEARFDRDSIMIGDRVTLTVEVDKDVMQVVGFPGFDDNMIGGVLEVLEDCPADTLRTEGRAERISKRYVLTSFEEGDYRLGGFPVLYLDKNLTDTLYSPDSLGLFVGTYPIDTASRTVYDIKPTAPAPLLVGEVRGYILWGLAALCVLAAVAWLIVSAVRRPGRPTVSHIAREPANVAAIRELEALQNQKLWQSGRHKQYYTRLTDIIRKYISGRWDVAAMEMTSDEIIASAAGFGLAEKASSNLERLLRTADLVKFAKYVPKPQENDSLWYDSYYFVEETKEEPEAADAGDGGKEAADE